jgi:gas vesicle protein
MRAENRNLLLGTLIGTIVGGAAAVLLAPGKGDETRTKLREAADRARERVTEITARGKEYYQHQMSQFQEAVEVGRRAAQEKRMELEQEVHAQSRLVAGRGE